MRRFSIFIVLFLLVVLLSARAVIARGEVIAYRQMRTLLLADIDAASKLNNPVLQEYLKARYYYISNKAKVRLRSGEGDFGPVDEAIIDGFVPGKDVTTFQLEYGAYTARMRTD